MTSTSTKVGHGLAKVLGIKLDYRSETGSRPTITRGESVFSVNTADSYIEEEPTAAEWVRSITPNGRQVGQYFINLFPFLQWITRYNAQWLMGDLVAGITIGAVVVPQGMAYAKLAELPVQFGLYSSFMGVLIYWFFATSKDITIGVSVQPTNCQFVLANSAQPVAVMSQLTGNVVLQVTAADPSILPQVAASALAIIAGSIVCFLGLARLGWLVDFISLTSISAFMTGAALNIAVGQIPTMMGIKVKGFSTRAPTYMVIINTLKYLGHTKIDAALGLTALTMLYLIRFIFNTLAKKQPGRRKLWFFCNTLRTVFVILLYTLISWLVNLHLPDHNSKKSPFAILGTVPRGFQDAAVPTVNKHIISLFVNQLPASVIVLIIEHISISKSFGRVNNYTIDPSQELVAIGVTNLLGPFLSAYPATGSFSRTAIKSKAGVRTPLAGLITAVVVLLAIYALPAVFFYIPSAALSAVIIHAVGDLITPPNTVYQFWRISPLEVFIFFAGVLVTVFSTIEIGIYTTVAVSAALLLWRVFKAQGRFLGRVKVHSVVGDHVLEGEEAKTSLGGNPENDPDTSTRNIFLPVDHGDGSNPQVEAQHPYPGIFIFRFSEGYNYPNANHYLDYMVKGIFKQTRITNPHSYPRLGDRPWNDPGPKRGKAVEITEEKPTLKAVILDFSSVNNVDITSIQNLIDVRNQLDRYAAPNVVQWHLACINNRWTKRALVSAGFGYPALEDGTGVHRWKPIFSVAEMGGELSPAAAAEERENKEIRKASMQQDVEAGQRDHETQEEITRHSESESSNSVQKQVRDSKAYRRSGAADGDHRVAVVQGLNRPFFHVDLTSALQSAVHNIEVQAEVAYESREPETKAPVVTQT